MKPFVSSLCAAAMALSVAIPANAGVMQAPTISTTSNVIKVQGTDYSGVGNPNLYLRRGDPGRFYRGDRSIRYSDRPIYRDDAYYWRGHRGIRYYRPGYRRHGNWWFPAAAFLGGAIIGGAIASQPRVRYRSSSAHVDWCYNRYRSYREWDNTFQPYRGPRRECISPYGP